MRIVVAVIVAGLLIVPVSRAEESTSPTDADRELAGRIARLVGQLNDDRGVERDAAEKKLLDLSGETAAESDRFLGSLPQPNDEMPLAVRERLARIRQKVEQRSASGAVAGTRVTLDASNMPLAEVFAAIEKQTGNKWKDNRENDPAAPAPPGISISLKDEPYWSAVDQILDQAKLGVYNYGGEDAIAVVPRDASDAPRRGAAQYVGPFRVEVLEVQAQRNLRQPTRTSLKLPLELAWEPRLRPIAVTQPAAEVQITTDSGEKYTLNQPEATLDLDVPNGTQAAEIVLPFALPPRTTKKVASIKGKLIALVPGRTAKFRFNDLAHAAGKTQRQGGVTVTIDDVRKNNQIWEVHMRLRLDEDNHALEKHRNWVLQNVAVLEDKDGKPIDNAGIETELQKPDEVGLAYLYDVPDGVDGLTWVYQTPAAIVELPVEYELKDIELP